MCPCDSTSSTSAGFWAWKSGWLKSMQQQQQPAFRSAHLNWGHSACRSAWSVKPLSSRILFIPLKKPWHIWVILLEIKVLGYSTWKHSTAHLTLPIFPKPVLWKFGHMSCWGCIVSLFLVPRWIVEAKSCHSSSWEFIFKEPNSFFSLCTQICTVKVAISALPSLEYDMSLLGSGKPFLWVLFRWTIWTAYPSLDFNHHKSGEQKSETIKEAPSPFQTGSGFLDACTQWIFLQSFA